MEELLSQGAELLRDTAVGAVLGVAIGTLALAAPLRRVATRPRIVEDAGAALLAGAFGAAVQALLNVPTGLAMERLDGWYEGIGEASWFAVAAYVVLADLGAYWAHRALHTRWLWHTHAWHHAPKHLNWLSGLRGSPIHFLVLLAPYYLAFVVLPIPEAAFASAALLVLDVANQHYIHSNLKLPFARQLEWLFVTPRFHFVHHSAKPEVANSNYGFIFSVWDRLFGSYTDPERVPDDDALGLGYEVSSWRLALGLPPPRATRGGR